VSGVRAKKHLGQHFLKDDSIALEIAEALPSSTESCIEIGPGTGVLTKFLLKRDIPNLYLSEVDQESVVYLKKHYPSVGDSIYGDFLRLPLGDVFETSGWVIGNFPYNISSQIFFGILGQLDKVDGVVCMLQKEVAQRIISKEGNKQYGILSVILQQYFTGEYLFTVAPESFIPPPKVQSGVIRLTKKETLPDFNYKGFLRFVKQGFNNRRKTLRNALKPLNLPEESKQLEEMSLRAEQLSPEAFLQFYKKLYTD
jgi:16S rRNA (adenine1518-N6/adenine1519-N6)-dimethyltransferase